MTSRSLHLRAHRRVAGLSLIAALLLLAGCGSSHSSKSSSSSSSASSTRPCPAGQSACLSQSPKVKVTGPAGINANLASSLKKAAPTLTNVKVGCPAHPSLPATCPVSANNVVNGKSVPMVGKVKVIGVDTRTHTYATELTIGPKKH